MKQPKRILAYSAVALLVMLAAFGAIAFDTSNVAQAQSVPMAPTLTAQASGASTINLSWDAVTDAARYELWAWDNVNEWQRLDGGETTPLTATTFAHTGLTAGTTYYYQVRAINSAGAAGAWSDRVNEVAGTTAPGRPVLTATAGYLQITVSWPAVTNAATYELWAWDSSWTRLNITPSATSYTHTGLTAGRTYYYQARATSSGNVMGAWSAQVSAVVLSEPNISEPTSFMADRGDQMVMLSWGAPTDISGLTLAGYEYRYAASGTALPATWMSAGNVMSATVSGLTNGTTYNFELRAVSTTDAKGDVATASATPSTVPDAPVLTATPGYKMVMLSWTVPANNGAAITRYHIERLNTQNQWVPENSPSSTATSYSDTGLNDSTVYTYRIIAENVAGRSSASNSAAATTLAQAPQVPGMPTGIGATSGPGSVTLTWQSPLFNGGSPIIRYEYRYKLESATSYSMSFRSAMLELMVKVEPLTPGQEYDFEVRAVNSAGAGDAANTDGITDANLRTPDPTAPTAVPRLRTTLGTHTGTVLRHQTNAAITVSWDALGPTVNGGAAITDYELCYKKLTDSAWMRWDDTDTGFSDPAAVGGGGALWSAVHGADGGLLDPGTTYQYRARAVNTAAPAATTGTTCTHHDGDWSVVTSATTPEVAPAAPTLAAFDDTTNGWDIDVNSITIKWTEPTMTGGADITGFEVRVSTPDTNPDTGIGGAQCETDDAANDVTNDSANPLGATVTRLPAQRMEYISLGLTADQVYCYRVRARNGSGTGRVSLWSNEVRARTTVTQAGTPGAPTGLALDTDVSPNPATDGSVTIEWTAPADRGSLPITSYEVQYQRDDDDDDDDWSDATVGMPNPPTATTFVHMQAPGGSTIEYRVRAVNGNGAGAWSDNDGATEGMQPFRQAVAARAADAPMLTATAAGDDEILLQWTVPENNGTPITGYVLQRWDPDAGPPAWDATIGPADDGNLLGAVSTTATTTHNTPSLTAFGDDNEGDGLDAGTTYYYRIRAAAESGGAQGTWSTADGTNTGAASAMTAAGTPAMVTITTPLTVTANSITLGWMAPNNGGSTITGYELRAWDGSDWMTLARPAAGDTSYTHDDLAPGTRHYYTLAAININGRGPWSASATAMVAAGMPDAPMLTAEATGATSILLEWTEPDRNGATITSYQLQRWDNSDPGAWTDTNLLTGTAIGNTDAETVTRFEDIGLTAGTKYYYRVRALPQADDTSGWSATNISDAASATTDGGRPGRPTWPATAFTATDSSLVVDWDAPTASGDSAINAYEVRIWNGSSWVLEANLGNVTMYTDMNLDAGTKYYYVVRAINSQGKEGLWSAYKAGTTTASTPDAPVLTATATGMTTIRLTWTVPDDNGTPITGYVLQRWEPDADNDPNTPADWGTTNLLGDVTVVGETVRTLFVDTGRMPGVTYYYRIQAATAGDNGAWSTIKSATTVPGAPDRPTDVTATADGQNAIDLSWTAAEDNGSAIVRYELQRWDAGSSMWRTIRNDLPSTRTSYKDTSLMADMRYVYRIRGVNRAADNNGMGKWSTIVSASTAK